MGRAVYCGPRRTRCCTSATRLALAGSTAGTASCSAGCACGCRSSRRCTRGGLSGRSSRSRRAGSCASTRARSSRPRRRSGAASSTTRRASRPSSTSTWRGQTTSTRSTPTTRAASRASSTTAASRTCGRTRSGWTTRRHRCRGSLSSPSGGSRRTRSSPSTTSTTRTSRRATRSSASAARRAAVAGCVEPASLAPREASTTRLPPRTNPGSPARGRGGVRGLASDLALLGEPRSTPSTAVPGRVDIARASRLVCTTHQSSFHHTVNAIPPIRRTEITTIVPPARAPPRAAPTSARNNAITPTASVTRTPAGGHTAPLRSSRPPLPCACACGFA
mmetsp:Transcript_14355/g.46099  ORF Transcript_14355/g.46099 Transcript_14355/m.46099 type:complete len:334 (+) Transcript_14355:587-1588(+)